jgi:hypothetical protein
MHTAAYRATYDGSLPCSVTAVNAVPINA